ncbi:Tetratricopeptide repeat family protein [Lunatimonas lonarensis]|uniref:Tetratricopeptide repeat family protein n=1 Tax=Lunatimonas lonarensis TaxID=1232681 RepID=R7ZYZ6_9BACT|nr:class I SAM-dependent methyltransferase [Lunatimonas lonarensis]EON79322.1 Tetratricopeptide repeat family protein [Lunatimonas lonarensis]
MINLKSTIFRCLHKKFSAVQRNIDNQIPKLDLQEKHIKNLRIIPNRHILLAQLQKYSVIAEIGVNEGLFSREILSTCNPKKLHLIDTWNSNRYHDGLRLTVQSQLQKEIEKGQVVINHGYSTDVAEQFPDFYFDWIYIDTDHSYSMTKSELHAYKKKVKPGGIMAGHDYAQGNWGKLLRYGVMEAVHEFCINEEWELIYLTVEMSINPSFAIRKIP